MNQFDFDAVNQALDAERLVPEWVPDGHRRGSEWVARNPNRRDNNPGSFTINLVKGVWKDYATGDGGSDLVSLYAYLFHHDDQGAAIKELAANHGVRLGDPETRQRAAEVAKVKQLDEARPELVLPIPAHATAPKFWHPRWGQASTRWEYKDREGRTLLFVCRFDPEGERKQVVPYSWCKHPDGAERWTWRGITGTKKRPLYGLDRLAADPEADAIVVEGEKTADAAQRLFGESAICVTWLGGVETADRANINALAGRRVVLWPDFDSLHEPLTKAEIEAGVDPKSKPLMQLHEQPGVRAMMHLAQALKGVAREVLMVGYTVGGEFPHGWDLADGAGDGWTTENAAAYLAQHAGDPWHIASVKAGQAAATTEAAAPTTGPAAAVTPPAPANDNHQPLPLEASVNPFGFPHMGEKGQPLNTVENLAYMLGEYGIRCRYNLISKETEISIPGMAFSQDNRAAASLATIGSLCARNRMPKSDLGEYITLISDANPYNPAADWIDSKPWDGQDRITALAATLDPEDAELATALLRRWMIGAVGCVYEPAGQSMQGMLVLQGPQNSGKTTWFWSLTARNKNLAAEGVTLNPSDRDSVKMAISKWLVELGELDATFRKSDIAQMKSFLTKDSDELFLRYSRASSQFPRRTAFVGTVNHKHYLHDETGNRRYWTVRHGPGLKGVHDVDMQQAWAQAKTLWAAGEQHRLTMDELNRLNVVNEEHREPNSIEELILARFAWNHPREQHTSLMSATEVLVAVGFDKPSNKQAKDCGEVLRKLTGAEPTKSNGRMVFRLPLLLSKTVTQTTQRNFEHNDEDRPF